MEVDHARGPSIRSATRSPRVLVPAAFLLVDAVFLYWIWVHFPNWGIWDWDFSQTLLEAARTSVVEHGQLPLWNPFVGGGFTLVGHPQVRAFNPSFAVILTFGTIVGVKICILLYLLVAQWGAFALARAEGLSRTAAFLAAIVFSLSGWYAQHIAHGHFMWIGFCWVPFVAIAFHRAATRLTPRSLVVGGIFYGVALLDGGPYVVGFPVVFLGLYAGTVALRARTFRPLLACAAVLGIGAAIAAIQVVPIAETFFTYRRETPALSNFYHAPFEFDWLSMLHQGLVSRQQAHGPARWMPYVINVGSYVGWLPLLLAAAAVVLRLERVWHVAVTVLVSLWIYLGSAAPFDLWAVIHEVPILGSLQVPARFNVFAVLSLALLAGHGLDALRERRSFGWPVAAAPVAIVAADMTAVNAPVFKVAFAIPPVDVREPGSFFHHQQSPYRDGWADRALYPIFPNWPNVTYASTLENTGVIEAWHNLKYPRRVVPKDHALYPGSEVWSASSGLRVTGSSVTPNLVAIDVEGDAGLVAINQNFHPGWKVVGGTGRIADLDGLVSVFVPAGAQRLEVAFRPRSFEVGASVSALALLLAAVALWLDRPGRQRR